MQMCFVEYNYYIYHHLFAKAIQHNFKINFLNYLLDFFSKVAFINREVMFRLMIVNLARSPYRR